MRRNNWAKFPSPCVIKTQPDVNLNTGKTLARGKGGETQDLRRTQKTQMLSASGVGKCESGMR